MWREFFFIIEIWNKTDLTPIIVDCISEGVLDNVWSPGRWHQTDVGYLLKMEASGHQLNELDSTEVETQAKKKKIKDKEKLKIRKSFIR